MRFLSLFFLAFAVRLSASELAVPRDSRQLVVVTTHGWGDSSGTLRRFVRSDAREAWRAVGPAISVKVGRAGMAWGRGLHANPSTGPRKIEGDKKAPAGVFRLTAAFGYGARPAEVTLRYIRVTPGVEAVDDSHSRFYNQIVDRTRIANPDWRTSEKMRLKSDEYRFGIVVAHNPKAIPGAGSNIFLHVWRNPNHATTGCTAMPLEVIEELQRWLTPRAKPVLVQAPRVFLPIELR